MRVTRADVAKKASVSTATVSYVINGSHNVSDRTKARVMDAIRELNYRPDMIARSMTTNETMQLSLMVNDISNPFYSEIIKSFENAAIDRGYFVNVCTGNKDIDKYFDNYLARRIDGVFIVAVPNKFNIEKLYELTENGIKVIVSGNCEADIKKVSSIECDYIGGMYTACSYLLSLGHKKIAYLSGFSQKQRFDRRIEGYLTAMEQLGLSSDKSLLLEGKFPFTTNVEDGYRMAEELIKSGTEFTAVICTNDLMAMGAISAFTDAGFNIPEDISVIGIDDSLFSRIWRPSISSIAVNKTDFGRKAFNMLYTNIKHGTTGYYLNPMELIKRDSTGPVKQ